MLLHRLENLPVPTQDSLPLPSSSNGGDRWWQKHGPKIQRVHQLLSRVALVVAVAIASLWVISMLTPHSSPLRSYEYKLFFHAIYIVLPVNCICRIWQYFLNKLYAKHEVNYNVWLAEQVRLKLNEEDVDKAFEMLRVLNANFIDNTVQTQRNRMTNNVSAQSILDQGKKTSALFSDVCFEVATTYARKGNFALALDLIPKDMKKEDTLSRQPQRANLLLMIQKECEWRIHETDVRERFETLMPENVLPKEVCGIIKDYLISTQGPLREIQTIASELTTRWSWKFSAMRTNASEPGIPNFDCIGGMDSRVCPKEESSVTLWVYRSELAEG